MLFQFPRTLKTSSKIYKQKTLLKKEFNKIRQTFSKSEKNYIIFAENGSVSTNTPLAIYETTIPISGKTKQLKTVLTLYYVTVWCTF